MTSPLLRVGFATLTLVALGSPVAAQAAPARGAVNPAIDAIADVARRLATAPTKHVHFAGRDYRPHTPVPAIVTVRAGDGAAAIAFLKAHGAVGFDASKRAGNVDVSFSIPVASIAQLRAVPRLVAATLDGPLVPALPPLDITAGLAGVSPLRNTLSSSGMPLTGQGITVCSVDSGVDVFHPMFFRADGGAFDFVDRNGNGKLDPGIDGVDVGTGVHTIRAMNGEVISRRDGMPMFGTEDPAFDPDFDYLYVDENENQKRDFGPDGGFTDASPSFGEMLFVLDDVNGDGTLQLEEKLVGLKSSKIKAFRRDDTVYRRGENLSAAPWDEDMMHGTGSTSVVIGGQAGYRRLVGMAPDADLVMASSSGWGQLQMTSFCVSEGAKVVLHEYAPCQGFHLDGSSPLEERIDETSAEGVSHVNPAGNFSTSEKLYKHVVPAGQTTIIPMRLPEIHARYLYGSVLFHGTERTPALRFRGPGGLDVVLPATPVQTSLGGGLSFYAGREDSSRGMVRYDFYLLNEQAPLPVGDYEVELVDDAPAGGPDLQLFAYVTDEISGWGKGAGFTDHLSEDHWIGWPGTADHGMAIAAYTGTGYESGEPGTRAYYSGRGRRIDGEPILWVSGPADPIVGTRYDDKELGYLIYGGTSGSSPHVTGVAALIHQAFPGLSGDQVKEKIAAGARTDAETGAVPNEDWGHGKLDGYRSIFGKDAKLGVPPVIATREATVARGPSTIPITVQDADSAPTDVRVELDRTYDGTFEETLVGSEIAVDFPELGDQRLRLRAIDETGSKTDAILLVHVVESIPTGAGGAGGGDATTSTGAGAGANEVELTGGGCAVGPVSRDGAGWTAAIGALAALLTTGRRRRRR